MFLHSSHNLRVTCGQVTNVFDQLTLIDPNSYYCHHFFFFGKIVQIFLKNPSTEFWKRHAGVSMCMTLQKEMTFFHCNTCFPFIKMYIYFCIFGTEILGYCFFFNQVLQGYVQPTKMTTVDTEVVLISIIRCFPYYISIKNLF